MVLPRYNRPMELRFAIGVYSDHDCALYIATEMICFPCGGAHIAVLFSLRFVLFGFHLFVLLAVFIPSFGISFLCSSVILFSIYPTGATMGSSSSPSPQGTPAPGSASSSVSAAPSHSAKTQQHQSSMVASSSVPVLLSGGQTSCSGLKVCFTLVSERNFGFLKGVVSGVEL